MSYEHSATELSVSPSTVQTVLQYPDGYFYPNFRNTTNQDIDTAY